jgi:hypothetical protein
MYIHHLATSSKNSISLEFGLLHSLKFGISYFSFLILAEATKSRFVSGEKQRKIRWGKVRYIMRVTDNFPVTRQQQTCVCSALCSVSFLCYTIPLAADVDDHAPLWSGNELRCGKICFTYNFLLGPSSQYRFHYNLNYPINSIWLNDPCAICSMLPLLLVLPPKERKPIFNTKIRLT